MALWKSRRFCIPAVPGFCVLIALSCCGQEASSASAAQQWMQSGAAAMRRGQPAEAERDFRQALVADPHFADAMLGLGMSLLRQNKPEEASHALQQAVAANPAIRGARMFIGIVDYQHSDFDDALNSLQAESALQPDNAEVLTWIGIVELAAGHPEQATVPLDQAAALESKDLNILYYKGRAHTLVAQSAYQKLFELGPDSWQMHRALGEIDSQSREPEKAVKEFEAALEKQPNDPDLYQSIGDEDQRLNRFDEATRAYEQELRLHPGDPVALFNLGKIQVQTGDAARASRCSSKRPMHMHPPPLFRSIWARASQKQDAMRKLRSGWRNALPAIRRPSSAGARGSNSRAYIANSICPRMRRGLWENCRGSMPIPRPTPRAQQFSQKSDPASALRADNHFFIVAPAGSSTVR